MFDFDSLLKAVLEETGIELKNEPEDKARYYPEGLRWKFFSSRTPREWKFCYSTVRNSNGKFTSWVLAPKGPKKNREWEVTRFVETRRMNAAKRRALKMYSTYMRTVEKRKAKHENLKPETA